jgi:hypothetical protein
VGEWGGQRTGHGRPPTRRGVVWLACRGRWADRSVGEVRLRKPHPRPATLTAFGPRTTSVSQGDLRVNAILLISREFCCAGTVSHGGACLRCRRHGWLCSSDEGPRGPGARRAGREHRARGQRQHVRGTRRGATRPGQGRYFGTEGVATLDTWLPPTCKEGSVRGKDKGCRV